ncbi:MAG: YegS/Rv2252/BmrU family lipid kinase [Prevotella sp.]|nr:YegS/Rv2252/BmrU family lipid kinase [Prevotella sp.]
MDNKKWGIIFCPKSGAFRPKKRWQKVEDALRENGIDYDHVQSETRDSVGRLVKMFINNGYRTIVIVGGDSAMNDAVNCLMQIEASEREQIALGVIPNGLLNDFTRFWGIHEDDEANTVKQLKALRTRKIDVGCIRYTNKNGEECRRYFLNCVNIGLVATIMQLRRSTRHFLGSRVLSFIASLLLLLFQRMEYAMKIRIDSSTIDHKVMTMCVGNAHGYGQTPSAVPYNGMLDVSIVYQPKIMQIFGGFYLLVKGKILNHRSVHPYRARNIHITEARHAMLSIDGRVADHAQTPFTINVEQEVLNFIIP